MDENSSSCDNDDDAPVISNRTTCPLSRFDCRGGQFEESTLSEHYNSEKHQKSLVRCIQQLPESRGGGGFTEADIDMDEGPTSVLDTSYNRLSVITKDLITNSDKLTEIDAEVFQFSKPIINFSERINDVQTQLLVEKSAFDAISTNQNVLKEDIITLKEQIDHNNQIIKREPDGTMVWKITNVREKVYDAQSERQTSIYSPAFFTSPCGYRVCARLYLNGDGSARGSHASVFLVILRGPYDDILQWPFSSRVSFCLFDQRTMIEKNGAIPPKHIIESFRPDTNSISFQKPCSAMNIASGIPKFFSLNELNELTNDNRYVINDTMYIKTFIDFIGMARSMVPFIFHINLAFPLHIQQKLINDEIKRREEQNMN